jgi:hypothetical protein
MGAEGPKTADLHRAGFTGPAPAVLADCDRFLVDVLFAAGHERRNRLGFAVR